MRVAPQHLVGSVAKHAAGSRVDEGDPALAVDAKEAVSARIENMAGLRFGAAQFGRALDDQVFEMMAMAFQLVRVVFLRRDVLVDTQHADRVALLIVQGQLRGAPPDLPAVRGSLRFLVAQLGNTGRHDLTVVGTIARSPVRPTHLVVIAADHLGWAGFAGIVCEGGIAAEIAQLAVLPEHPHRHGIDNGLQHLARLVQRPVEAVLGLAHPARHQGRLVLRQRLQQMIQKREARWRHDRGCDQARQHVIPSDLPLEQPTHRGHNGDRAGDRHAGDQGPQPHPLLTQQENNGCRVFAGTHDFVTLTFVLGHITPLRP